MNYIILDLEWNQPFKKTLAIKKPVHLIGEIIQIGAVMLDENLNYISNFKIGVHPKYYTKMHREVSKITNIDNEQLQFGFIFPSAFKWFREWCGRDFVFLTWGPDDIPMLNDNMRLHKLDTNWIPPFYDIQIIFNAQITKEKRQWSLQSALEKVNEMGLTAHDALNDAINTYKVCNHLNLNEGINNYSKYIFSKKRPIQMHLGVYKSKIETMQDHKTNEIFCPVCGERMSHNRWVNQNVAKKISTANCGNCGEFFVRLKFTKTKSGNFSVNRIIYFINDELKEFYNIKSSKMLEKCKLYYHSIVI